MGYLLYMAIMIISYKLPWKNRNWFAIVSFTLLLGLRGNGIDYVGYSAQFQELVRLNYNLFDERFYNAIVGYSKQNFEFLYLIMIKICKALHWSNVPFFMFIAFCQIFFLDLFVQRFKSFRLRGLLIFYFFTTLMFVETFNVMRQMIALLIFLNIIPYIVKRDYKRYFLCTGFLYFVHSSSLILLPLYFFIHLDFLKNKKVQLGIFLASMLFSSFFIGQLLHLFDVLFMNFGGLDLRMVGYFNTDADVVQSKDFLQKTTLVVLFRLLSFIFLLLNCDSIKQKWKSYGVIAYNMTYIGFIFQEFIFGISLQRLNYYFYYNSFIVLAMASFYVFSAENKKAFLRWYGLFIFVLYTSWFINSVYQGAADCAPYVISKYL